MLLIATIFGFSLAAAYRILLRSLPVVGDPGIDTLKPLTSQIPPHLVPAVGEFGCTERLRLRHLPSHTTTCRRLASSSQPLQTNTFVYRCNIVIVPIYLFMLLVISFLVQVCHLQIPAHLGWSWSCQKKNLIQGAEKP